MVFRTAELVEEVVNVVFIPMQQALRDLLGSEGQESHIGLEIVGLKQVEVRGDGKQRAQVRPLHQRRSPAGSLAKLAGIGREISWPLRAPLRIRFLRKV